MNKTKTVDIENLSSHIDMKSPVKEPYWARVMSAEIQKEIDKCILGAEFVTEEKK